MGLIYHDTFLAISMFNLLQSAFAKREIYFHEDDYCQQELLPRQALAFVEREIKKSDEFTAAHVAPGGIGWTDLYVRQDPPMTFGALKMTREDFDVAISPHLPPFEQVYTGYGSFRERCKKAAAWGTSQQNAIFVDWNDEGIINNVWTQFFESDEKSISAASKSLVALGMLHSLIYVDWAWSFVCEIFNEDAFASRLRSKLADIAERTKKAPEG
jgi:hypothetical protein